MNFSEKTVLITGASGGIGEAYARYLAAKKANLILVARSEEKLNVIAQELRNVTSQVTVIPTDLSDNASPLRLFEAIEALGLQVDVLINNAGFGTYGRFEEQSIEKEAELIDLNCRALVGLCHRFAVPMLERGSGMILNIASTAGLVPVPYMSTYAGSKAFVVSFSESLWAEFEPRGVFVRAICPGYTRSGFQAEFTHIPTVGKWATAEELVRDSLEALKTPGPVWLHGTQNRFASFAARFAPRSLLARRVAGTMKPR